jgi:formiminoglutamase
MEHRITHTVPARWPAIKPGCYAASIRTNSPHACAIALLGLPDDTGVQLNGGRPGAAEGPNAFRAALAKYGTNWDAQELRELDVPVYDAGNVPPADGVDEAALLETHARVERAVREVHELGLVAVCIGGGHDLSLPSITALAKHINGSLGGVNCDAHLDVRRKVGSGMAFRRLIEDRHLDPKRFIEVGLGQFANEASDFQWLIEQGAQLIVDGDILDSRQRDGHSAIPESWLNVATSQGRNTAFCSLDLDAVNGAYAPGVSAINALGLEVRHVAKLARAAGADAHIRHFDIMELSPPHDQDGRTSRIAALLFLSFLSGWKNRPA